MKKINYYILGACLSLGLVSCSGFLDEENLSNVNSDEYFTQKDGYENLVNAAYATLRTMWKNEPWLFNLGVDIYTRGESELIGGSYENRDVYSSELNEYATLDAQNGYVREFYDHAYYGIQVINTVINKGQSVSGMSEAEVNKRVAEVRFLRAYYYYLLVEQFGPVPIVTEEINTPVTEFVRTPEKDVYDFILNELNDVVNVLPASQEDYGRITQGAAKHLMALTYLTRGYKSYGESGDFAKAAAIADELINGGQYQLLPTFEEVFATGNEKNQEIIFSVQYDKSSLGGEFGGNGQQNLYGFELWYKVASGFEPYNLTYGWKKNQFMPTQFLYSLYDTQKDCRYDATFKSEFYATTADNTIGLKEGDLRLYFPKYDQPLSKADSLTMMAEHPNVIIIPRDRWKQDIEGIGGSGMCPMIWKFYDPNAIWPGNNTNYTGTKDIFLFRLADTYLLAAEAYLKAGNAEKAAERINAVRQRAALAGHEADMKIAAADVDIDFILDERAREMAGEYNRWMDLKRTGKLIERTLKHNNLAAKINKMDSHVLLRPIPQTIIDQTTGGNFSQNEGY